MASPGGKEPLLSRRAGRLPPVNDLCRPRSGTEREGGPAGSRPGPVADSPAAKPRCDHRPAPAAGPCAWGSRDTFPAGTPALRFSRTTGPAASVHGLAASSLSAVCRKLRLSVSSLTHRRTCVRYVRKLRHVAQKERLPKMGSLTGEDCGVACRRLKATWQGLLPFRGRTGSGAVTRHVTGSDVLR